MRRSNLFHTNPLVPVALSLVLGICVGNSLLFHVTTSCWFAVIYILLVVCYFIFRRPLLQSMLLNVSVFCLGCMLISRAEDTCPVVYPEEETDYEAVVASEPEERGRVLRFDMIITSGPYIGRTVKASLLKDTVACRYLGIMVGDGLKVRSLLRPPSNNHGSDFDYVTYLKTNGISGQTFIYYRNWEKAYVDVSSVSTVRRARNGYL